MNLSEEDWKKLEDLRKIYLHASSDGRSLNYWNETLLSLYDLTFGLRIQWKWQAVLEELKELGFRTSDRTSILDWGCGTGVASRSFINYFPSIKTVQLYDRSPQAIQYSEQKLKLRFPNIEFSDNSNDYQIVLISHVLTELSEEALSPLLEKVRRARTVLWVEPGTPSISRRLISIRENLKSDFNVIAPCTHQTSCGLNSQLNSQHWCHFYAPVPPEVFQSRFWRDFSKRLGIDLRSLPVSYLVLSKDFAPSVQGARVLAGTRFHKGYAQVLKCMESGVTERKILERMKKAKIKELKRNLFRTLIQND